MDRVVDVDLREMLMDIAKKNTFYHLDCDINISFNDMERAAKLNDFTEKTLIWVSYPSGIDCYSEREVLQKDTRGYNGILFHGFDMQSEHKLTYAVEITEAKGGDIRGNLYEIDIREYAAFVKENAVPSNAMRLYVDDLHNPDKQTVMPLSEFNNRYPLDLPKMEYWRNEPADLKALDAVINNLWDYRVSNYRGCSAWKHTDKLLDKQLDFYAERLVNELNKHQEPNGLGKRSFTAALDTIIAHNFKPEQLSRLLDKLPFANASFAVQKGGRDMKLVVPKNEVLQFRQEQGNVGKQGKTEVRGKPDKSAKPSVLAALESNEQKVKQQYGDKSAPGKDTPKKDKPTKEGEDR